jgi:hypothetical protein
MEPEIKERFERIEAITAGHAEFVANHEQFLAPCGVAGTAITEGSATHARD